MKYLKVQPICFPDNRSTSAQMHCSSHVLYSDWCISACDSVLVCVCVCGGGPAGQLSLSLLSSLLLETNGASGIPFTTRWVLFKEALHWKQWNANHTQTGRIPAETIHPQNTVGDTLIKVIFMFVWKNFSESKLQTCETLLLFLNNFEVWYIGWKKKKNPNHYGKCHF